MRASLFHHFLYKKFHNCIKLDEKLSLKMRTKNVALQVLESTCSWKREIKFKDILCSFFCSPYLHYKTTNFSEMALELLYLSYFKSYRHLKFSRFF